MVLMVSRNKALHSLLLTLLCGTAKTGTWRSDGPVRWNLVTQRNQNLTPGMKSSHVSPSSFTCWEDTDDSVSGCPSGHSALDCPNHRTNCIIRPAPLGMDAFWSIVDTRRGKGQNLTNYQSWSILVTPNLQIWQCFITMTEKMSDSEKGLHLPDIMVIQCSQLHYLHCSTTLSHEYFL